MPGTTSKLPVSYMHITEEVIAFNISMFTCLCDAGCLLRQTGACWPTSSSSAGHLSGFIAPDDLAAVAMPPSGEPAVLSAVSLLVCLLRTVVRRACVPFRSKLFANLASDLTASGMTVVRDRPNQRWSPAEESALRRGIAKCVLD